MISNCICYISDRGYLFPTLLSAIQVRGVVPDDLVDVAIFFIDEKNPEVEATERIARANNVGFHMVARSQIDNMPIMFARLFLDRFVPKQYTLLVYLDGDTQIAGTLSALLDVRPGPGCFLAARDPLSLISSRAGRRADAFRNHMTAIGLPSQDFSNYINSGVLIINRDGWDRISNRALSLYKGNPMLFKFPDQDVINIAGRQFVSFISYKWNFPAFLIGRGYDRVTKPCIYHFMSNPRPWQGPFRPWGNDWYMPYIELINKYPELAPFRPVLSKSNYLRYVLQQQYKAVFESVPWGSRSTIDTMSDLDATCAV